MRMPTEEELEKMTPEEMAAYQKANCLFCKIVGKEIEAKIVYEDAHCIGILDINPAAKGHVLLMPKEHFMLLPHVPEQVTKQLFLAARHISFAMLRAFNVQGTTLFIANGPLPQRQQLSSALAAVFGAAYGKPPLHQLSNQPSGQPSHQKAHQQPSTPSGKQQPNLDDVSKLFLGGQ